MTTKTYAERLTEDRRLVLLRLLADLPGYRGNSSVLTSLLDGFGHTVSRDYARTQLAWLEEQGLVRLEDIGPVLLASITERGLDVSRGTVIVPGVARPGT